MATLTLEEIFAPLNATSKILGILPYKAQNGRLVVSKIGIIQICLYITLYLVVTFIYCRTYGSGVHEDFTKIKTVHVVMIAQRAGFLVMMGLTFFNVFIKYQKFIDIRNGIGEVDSELVELDQEHRLHQSNRRLSKTLIALLAFSYFFLNFIPVSTFVLERTEKAAAFAFLIYPRLVATNVTLTFCAFTKLIHNRFKIINGIVLERMMKPVSDLQFCGAIRQLVNLHVRLVKKQTRVNSIFSLHILLWITINFICLVGNLYVTVYIIIAGLYPDHRRTCFVEIQNVTVHAISLYHLAQASSETCLEVRSSQKLDLVTCWNAFQANRTKKLLLGIRVKSDEEDRKDAVSAIKI
jgi:hypothetical protein